MPQITAAVPRSGSISTKPPIRPTQDRQEPAPEVLHAIAHLSAPQHRRVYQLRRLEADRIAISAGHHSIPRRFLIKTSTKNKPPSKARLAQRR